MSNNVKNTASLKKINTNLSQLQGEIEVEEQMIKARLKELEGKKDLQKKLNKKVKKLKIPDTPQVSEHCLIRYFERVRKEDIEAIKNEIISSEITEMMKILPHSGTFPNKAGYSVVFKNNNAVTILVNGKEEN